MGPVVSLQMSAHSSCQWRGGGRGSQELGAEAPGPLLGPRHPPPQTTAPARCRLQGAGLCPAWHLLPSRSGALQDASVAGERVVLTIDRRLWPPCGWAQWRSWVPLQSQARGLGSTWSLWRDQVEAVECGVHRTAGSAAPPPVAFAGQAAEMGRDVNRRRPGRADAPFSECVQNAVAQWAPAASLLWHLWFED